MVNERSGISCKGRDRWRFVGLVGVLHWINFEREIVYDNFNYIHWKNCRKAFDAFLYSRLAIYVFLRTRLKEFEKTCYVWWFRQISFTLQIVELLLPMKLAQAKNKSKPRSVTAVINPNIITEKNKKFCEDDLSRTMAVNKWIL